MEMRRGEGERRRKRRRRKCWGQGVMGWGGGELRLGRGRDDEEQLKKEEDTLLLSSAWPRPIEKRTGRMVWKRTGWQP